MNNFQQAMKYLIFNEGSAYTNDPQDHGGPTKFGITQEYLAQWRSQPVSPQDVEALTQEEAEKIYEAWYWIPIGCPGIQEESVAIALFDTAVNCGVPTATKMAQVAASCDIDGHMGPLSLGAINAMEQRRFLSLFIVSVQNRYISLVVNDPTQIKFLKGWLTRSQRLIGLMI